MPEFEPPGPGRWTRDTGRFPRQASPVMASLLPAAALRGFRAATRPYGLLLDHVAWAFVDGWAYMAPRRIAALQDHEVADHAAWQRLVQSSAYLRRRLAVSDRVFERRVWLEELARWHGSDKPAMAAANRAAARVDPEALDDGELLAHLATCRTNLRQALHLHHLYDVTPAVAVGDLLANLAAWTGAPAFSFLNLLNRGPRSVLRAQELHTLAQAIALQPGAVAALEHGLGSRFVVDWLRSLGGSAAPAVERCLDVVGWWIAGPVCDVDEPCILEVPEILADSLRAAVARSGGEGEGDGKMPDSAGAVRSALPARTRRAFDLMLEDAKAVQWVRDERALYCDVWATGVLRRGLLAAGRRLADAGRLEDPADVLETQRGELRALFSRGRGGLRDDLALRARRRRAADPASVPAVLGAGAWSPIKLDWLPPGAARTERAFRTFLAAMDDEPPASVPGGLSGLAASPGVREGRARVITRLTDLPALDREDVLVAGAASPSLIVLLPLVGAVVTDRGGLLSHAAIVARELGVPAVVGTGDATNRIPDGARVRVDGSAGVVTVLTG
ncbi:MAG TPA: PEP-utilizing enzyme [Candidatus Dormibacteraeota bacterium]